MTIETWDRTSLAEQEQLIGRHKDTGAPLGAQRERDELVPSALPEGAHVREAHPSMNGGATMLRRGYSFVDGSDGLGHLDAGLFFLAFQRDPRTAFVPVQQRLSRLDRMNEYVRHTGSALFAVPPGVRPGGWFGQALLG
jgi:deferrochelatase/peroxidase EfeB